MVIICVVVFSLLFLSSFVNWDLGSCMVFLIIALVAGRVVGWRYAVIFFVMLVFLESSV